MNDRKRFLIGLKGEKGDKGDTGATGSHGEPLYCGTMLIVSTEEEITQGYINDFPRAYFSNADARSVDIHNSEQFIAIATGAKGTELEGKSFLGLWHINNYDTSTKIASCALVHCIETTGATGAQGDIGRSALICLMSIEASAFPVTMTLPLSYFNSKSRGYLPIKGEPFFVSIKGTGALAGKSFLGTAEVTSITLSANINDSEVTFTVLYGNYVETTGATGAKGDKGDPFTIAKTYASVAAMVAGFSSDGVPEGSFVMIDTGNINDADNAKLYVKGASAYSYITDLSGATGLKGDKGDKGDTGAAGAYIQRFEPDVTTDAGTTYKIYDSNGNYVDYIIAPRGLQGEKGDNGVIEVLEILVAGEGTYGDTAPETCPANVTPPTAISANQVGNLAFVYYGQANSQGQDRAIGIVRSSTNIQLYGYIKGLKGDKGDVDELTEQVSDIDERVTELESADEAFEERITALESSSGSGGSSTPSGSGLKCTVLNLTINATPTTDNPNYIFGIIYLQIFAEKYISTIDELWAILAKLGYTRYPVSGLISVASDSAYTNITSQHTVVGVTLESNDATKLRLACTKTGAKAGTSYSIGKGHVLMGNRYEV